MSQQKNDGSENHVSNEYSFQLDALVPWVCCLFVKKYFHYKALFLILCHVLHNLETDHKLIIVFFYFRSHIHWSKHKITPIWTNSEDIFLYLHVYWKVLISSVQSSNRNMKWLIVFKSALLCILRAWIFSTYIKKWAHYKIIQILSPLPLSKLIFNYHKYQSSD